MKLEKFIDRLLNIGFVRNSNDKAENWYEFHLNGTSVFVGIMAEEVDYLGHCPIEVQYYDDETEVEKDYLTTTGAWRAIHKLIQSL